jgi:hypothetical protein
MENGDHVQNRNLAAASTSWRIDGAGDVDHDGDADILFRHSGGGVVTWEMQDGGFVRSHSFGVVSDTWQIARIGEFDVG